MIIFYTIFHAQEWFLQKTITRNQKKISRWKNNFFTRTLRITTLLLKNILECEGWGKKIVKKSIVRPIKISKELKVSYIIKGKKKEFTVRFTKRYFRT